MHCSALKDCYTWGPLYTRLVSLYCVFLAMFLDQELCKFWQIVTLVALIYIQII